MLRDSHDVPQSGESICKEEHSFDVRWRVEESALDVAKRQRSGVYCVVVIEQSVQKRGLLNDPLAERLIDPS